jgi:PAS domain S-box-containing protein
LKKGPSITQAELQKQLRIQTALVKEERAKGNALISSIGEGLIATDEVGKIVQVNQVALDILRYKHNELIGSWFPGTIIALHEDGMPYVLMERPATRVFMTGKVINENLYYKTKDGGSVAVSVTVSPIFLRGKPIGVIEVFRDISREIESDRVKTEFISLASHQLRTPLSSINLYSHMLKDGYAKKLTRSQNDLLKVIMSAASRMNNLINTLLNITRIESDNIFIESKPLNIAQLLEKLLLEFEPQIKVKQQTLSKKIDKKIPIINSNQVFVSEILNNLISNAIKYTPNEGRIKIELQKKKDALLFKVSDTGYGIPTEAQDFIFNKLFRASNILKHDVSGTGLGLYFTKTLAEKIGGEIWFISGEDKGTTFFFTIPLIGSTPQEGRFRLEEQSVIFNTE